MKRIFKFIKTVVIIIVLGFVGILALGYYANTPEVKAQTEQSKIEKAEKKAVALAEKEALKESLTPVNVEPTFDAYAKAVERKLSTHCMSKIREGAKYPSKVDFHVFKASDQTFKDFNTSSDQPHRMLFVHGGEMMNGIGNMVPFQAKCLYDFNLKGDLSMVELLII